MTICNSRAPTSPCRERGKRAFLRTRTFLCDNALSLSILYNDFCAARRGGEKNCVRLESGDWRLGK